MTTVAEKESTSDSTTKSSIFAVLLDLEGIGGSERLATFDVLVSILGEQGTKISPAHISRFCLGKPPEKYVGDLLSAVGGSRASSDKLVEDVKSGIAMQLSKKTPSLPQVQMDLLTAARERGCQIAALSGLPQATAESLLDSLGLADLGVDLKVMPSDSDDGFPRADSWLKLAKDLRKHPYNCAVIAGSGLEAKSALSAGMRCIAVPDQFTAFEDFSGANAILDEGNDVDPGEVLDCLFPKID